MHSVVEAGEKTGDSGYHRERGEFGFLGHVLRGWALTGF